MPDQHNLPLRVSPLLPTKGDFIVEYKNLRLSERKALTVIQILSFKGKHQDVAKAIADAQVSARHWSVRADCRWSD